MKKETILLTGATGYIGSHVAVDLIGRGRKVVIADNLTNSSAEVIDTIKKITGVRPAFYNVDLKDKEASRKIFEENEIGAVMHFAGLKAVGESTQKPVEYYRNNLDTTLTVLELMKEYDCKTIIFSSSATVYGEGAKCPITEDQPVGSCSNPYGYTKYFIERILEDAAKASGDMSVVLLRYFNPVGAHESGLIGENPNGIPNNLMPFITKVAAGKLPRLNVFGNDYPTIDGSGVRDYIHIADLSSGHVAALDYAEGKTGTFVFNLGTGRGYSVLEVVNTFIRVNDIDVPYVIAPRRPGDLAEVYADPSKANEVLGWKAEKTLEDMCRDAWRFAKKKYL